MTESKKKFYVFIEENSNYMDSDNRRIHGEFDTYKDAWNACRFLVENSVSEFFDYDLTAVEIYDMYRMYGLSAWFDPHDDGELFESMNFAKLYIDKLIELKPFLD